MNSVASSGLEIVKKNPLVGQFTIAALRAFRFIVVFKDLVHGPPRSLHSHFNRQMVVLGGHVISKDANLFLI